MSPQVMKTQLGKGKSANHRHRLDIFIRPCSYRNCSFHPRPTGVHHSVFLIMEPQVEAFYSDLLGFFFCFVFSKISLTDPYACMASAWEKCKLNKTICQLFHTVSQCDVELMAPQVPQSFGNHTVKKSNKQ